MDDQEREGRPEHLPVAEVWRRLSDGDSVSSIVRDLGTSEERIRRALLHTPLRIDLAAWLEEWLERGDPAADWAVVYLPDLTDAERIAALRRILERMDGPPVHPAKWRENLAAVLRALEDMGVRREDLAEARGFEAVAEVVGHLTPHEIREQTPEVVRSFWTALERLIMEDLLGPGWRKKTVQEALPLDPSALGPVEDEMFAAVEARAEVGALLDGADLTAGERDVLELARDGYDNREIAERLERTYAAVRRARSDGIRKIRDTLP